ncbi:MAG: L-lactate permease [Deltaproteobacteria bacterium]|nr:L-lactate permease [Deltaproteobacteria bacterium]
MSWSPVVLLTVLTVFLRRSALELSVYGLLFSLILAVGFFNTSPVVAVMAALDGILTTLPLLLVVLGGIFLSSLLMTTGSLKRIVEWFKGGAGDAFGRNVLITFGVGNFMEGSGVIAEPVVAPMLNAAGVSPTGSAALSIIGYAGLMTLELGGIIVTVLALVTGLPVRDLGIAAAWLSIPASLLMALLLPVYLPQRAWGLGRLTVIMFTGLFSGVVALAAAVFVDVSVSGTLAGMAVIFGFILFGSGRLRVNQGIFVDLAPFLFLLVCLLSVSSIPYLRQLTFEHLVVKVKLISVHAIAFRPLFSAYLYIFLAFLLAVRLQRVPKEQMKAVIGNGARKGWRAFVAMGLFGAMGQVISYTGYAPGFSELDSAHNIPWIISHGLAQYTGEFYPVFVPLLGWVGTFLTGYGVASLMLFGQLQVQAASLLGVSAVWLSAALAVGSSVGSISSPIKVALATPMCGAVGREGDILRWTIPLGALASLLIGVVVWLTV